MAARVTDDDVKEIIDTDIEELTAFILPAHIIVESILYPSGLLSEEHLKEIERWLSAHFLAIRDPRVTEAKIGEAQEKYFLNTNAYVNAMTGLAGLNATPYGQQVLILDTTNLLTQTLNKKTASLETL